MIIEPPLEKQPGEKFPFSIDFKNELGVGETISGTPTFVAKRKSDNSDVTADIKNAANPSVSGSIVTQEIKAGDHGQQYVLQLTILTNTTPAHEYQGEVLLVVKDIPAP